METAAAAQTLDSLNGQFGRAGLLAFTANSFGLIAAEITTELCRGRVYLQGAHVTEYQPKGAGAVDLDKQRQPVSAGQGHPGRDPCLLALVW